MRNPSVGVDGTSAGEGVWAVEGACCCACCCACCWGAVAATDFVEANEAIADDGRGSGGMVGVATEWCGEGIVGVAEPNDARRTADAWMASWALRKTSSATDRRSSLSDDRLDADARRCAGAPRVLGLALVAPLPLARARLAEVSGSTTSPVEVAVVVVVVVVVVVGAGLEGDVVNTAVGTAVGAAVGALTVIAIPRDVDSTVLLLLVFLASLPEVAATPSRPADRATRGVPPSGVRCPPADLRPPPDGVGVDNVAEFVAAAPVLRRAAPKALRAASSRSFCAMRSRFFWSSFAWRSVSSAASTAW